MLAWCQQFHLSEHLTLVIQLILMTAQCWNRSNYQKFHTVKKQNKRKDQDSFFFFPAAHRHATWCQWSFKILMMKAPGDSSLTASALISGLETPWESLLEVKPRRLDMGFRPVNSKPPLLSPVALMMDCKLCQQNRREFIGTANRNLILLPWKQILQLRDSKHNNVSFVTFSMFGLYLRFCKSYINFIFSVWQI